MFNDGRTGPLSSADNSCAETRRARTFVFMPRSRDAMSEPNPTRILVVPAAELDRLGRFQGFSREADRYLGVLLAPGVAEFRPRSAMETDPAFKQLIPYVVFKSGEAVFCYTRGKSQ